MPLIYRCGIMKLGQKDLGENENVHIKIGAVLKATKSFWNIYVLL